MGQIVLAIFVILIGAVIRAVGPATGRPDAAGASKVAGYGFMFAGLALALGKGGGDLGLGQVGGVRPHRRTARNGQQCGQRQRRNAGFAWKHHEVLSFRVTRLRIFSTAT